MGPSKGQQGHGMKEWTYHGGRLGAAQAAFADAERPWIDLSTGLNPCPYPTTGIAIDWAALPDDGALAALEAAAADYFGLPAGQICAVPGTEIGLRLLATLGLPDPVRIVAPAYRSYAEAWGQATTIAPSALQAEAARGGTLVLANPNNPDGRLWGAAELLDLAALCSRADGVLVVDEAFADAVPETSLLPHLGTAYGKSPIVLRSFGKFFGLGGLRLGFVAAGAAHRRLLRERLGSWPVSTAALRIGTTAYRDSEWITRARARLRDDAARLDRLLACHGLSATGDCPLFRLVATPDAAALFAALAARGILTRPFDYASGWLRLGLPASEEAWARLEAALAAARG
jgi:cobalamin biosynthetic protein CobC